ncbi:hypothetical protein D3C71_1771780 [compost metagenome]
MADIHHCNPGGGKAHHCRRDQIGLGVGQRTGWLVEDHHFGIPLTGPGDLHQLLLRRAEIANPLLRIDVHPEQRQRVPGLRQHAWCVNHAGALRPGPQTQVFRHAHVLYQA